MGKQVKVLELTAEEERELRRRVRCPTTSQRDSFRASIVLLGAEGVGQIEAARRLNTSQTTVSKWRRRFERQGIAGLIDKPGRGRKRSISNQTVEQVVAKASQPAPGFRQRSTRLTAREVGISATSVREIWRDHGLKPHRRRTFKLSRDPEFEEKFWDVVGLYLDPPKKSIVLCCDEKSQIQALERTQKGLPLGQGHIRTHTHDYYRRGTVTLFAALSYLDGKLISRLEKRHTHVEWLRFLKQIDHEIPEDLQVHVICDNYATHKHWKVKKWLSHKKRRRFHMHFTPTSSSWLNMVERFFADLTRVVRDGSFQSVAELRRHIIDRLVQHNQDPIVYRWTAKGEDVLEKIRRAREAEKALDASLQS